MHQNRHYKPILSASQWIVLILCHNPHRWISVEAALFHLNMFMFGQKNPSQLPAFSPSCATFLSAPQDVRLQSFTTIHVQKETGRRRLGLTWGSCSELTHLRLSSEEELVFCLPGWVMASVWMSVMKAASLWMNVNYASVSSVLYTSITSAVSVVLMATRDISKRTSCLLRASTDSICVLYNDDRLSPVLIFQLNWKQFVF